VAGTNELHFVTCSCYRRQCSLASRQQRDLLLAVFEEVRQGYGFVVVGYVVMPDHTHLPISEPEKRDPSRVMQELKQGFSRRVLKSVRKRRVAAQQELFAVGCEHVWQRPSTISIVWTARKRIEKLRYMHRNPVMRGLVQEPEQWLWSSYRSYALEEEGAVRINHRGEAKIKDPLAGGMSPPLRRKGEPATHMILRTSVAMDSERELIVTFPLFSSPAHLHQSGPMVENPLTLCATDNPPFTRA
jgi:putative transposase